MPCAARPCVGHRSLFDFRGKVVLRACAKWRSMVTISIIVFELCMRCFCLCVVSRSGELRTQKLRAYMLRRTRSSKVLPLKPGVGQYRAMHATPAARDFLLAHFYPSGPFTCIFFPKKSPEFFPCWLWLTPVPVWARRIK